MVLHSATEPLLENGVDAPATRITTGIKLIVASVYTLPFALSCVEMIKNRVSVGPLLSVGVVCIFKIGYTFYGKHVIEIFDPKDTIHHIGEELGLTHKDIHSITPWEWQKRFLISMMVIGATLPLGLTKIGLEKTSTPLSLSFKIAYLVLYSTIDACPHINHLQLQKEAVNKFYSLAWPYKTWVCMLMAGHALSDSADIWNATGFWLPWVVIALAIELYLSNVEAVAHYRPAFSEKITIESAAKFLTIFFGACYIAVFNWYSTFQTLNFSTDKEDTSKIAFLIFQIINIFFLTFEAWNHESELHHQHDHGHGDTHSVISQTDEELEANQQQDFISCMPIGASVSACGQFGCKNKHGKANWLHSNSHTRPSLQQT